ncbi:MAG: VacJ family lipoprotein [Burkholderiales bacterium]|nr:VacJ family lipoprotein [Burkholderiales bacterium]
MTLPAARFRTALVLGLLSLTLFAGCASTNNPRDPLEPLNRAVYQFNDGLDKVVMKPVATVYREALPDFVRTGVTNFFSNLYDILTALNSLLQGKIADAASDVGRIAVNTTIGIAGLFDVATEIGLEKHKEDFGQTLGRWGIGDGPYLQIPFLGPSSIRDAVGTFVDVKVDPIGWIWRDHIATRNSLWGLYFVNLRAILLDSTKILEEAALDPYEFQRDAYLQRRRNLVYDGNPPTQKDEDEMPELKTKPRTELDEPGKPSGAALDPQPDLPAALLTPAPFPAI